MSLADLATSTIIADATAVQQTGFGVPLILSANVPVAFGNDRIRFYSSQAGLVADGFTTTSPEYLAAGKLLGQARKPRQFAVGRRALKPTLVWNITPVAANSLLYRMRLGSTWVEYTSGPSATLSAIIAGLKVALDALGLDVTVADATTHMTITADNPGEWFALEVEDTSRLGAKMVHADPGLAADLEAIKLASSEWYCILNPFNSQAEVEAIGAFAEANTKLFIAATQDSKAATQAYVAASNSDVMTRVKDLGLAQTHVCYHPANDAFLDCALAGENLPKEPGSETWHAKRLANVALYTITETHKTNFRAKNGGWFYQVAGLNIAAGGKTGAGEWIDKVRGIHWLSARMQERIASRLIALDKVAYTDDGIAIIRSEVLGQLQDGIEAGLLASSPEPTCTAPLAADVLTSDKDARTLNDIEWTATLAGAIHLVNISGVVSV